MAALSRRRPTRPPRPEQAVPAAPFVGLGIHVSVLFLYGATPLLAPWWVAGALWVAWVALLVLQLRWWTPHPRRLPVVAVAGFVLWALVVVGGGIAQGWGWA
ncbi:MAG: hypothetical protein CMH83_03500 [Nocardioides sp.]|nr:hypothetical protein [Nocardioides sp.]